MLRGRRALRVSLAGASAFMVAVLAACSAVSGQSASDEQPGKTDIAVGTMPIIDTAPLQIALDRGFFDDEGLSVHTTTIQGGADGIPKMRHGSLDISFANYVSAFRTHAEGHRMRIAAEAYNADEDVLVVTAMPGSGIAGPEDLEGKTVAVNTLHNVGTLTVKSVLQTHGVNPSSVDFTAMPFPDMPEALKDGSVDAAWMVEPFISQVETELGAHEVFDSASGATEGFPIAGYVTTQRFQQKHPRTVAAFQRAIQRAEQVAHNRAAVEQVLPSYTKISPRIAAIATIGTYPTTIEATRLQRVPDLMSHFGVLDQQLGAKQLIS